MNTDTEHVFCKLCGKVTAHLDMRPLPVQFKCMACGEYNKATETLSLDSFKWE